MWKTSIVEQPPHPNLKPEIFIRPGDMDKFGSNFWVAKITGADDRFGLKRDFIPKRGGKSSSISITQEGLFEVFKSHGVPKKGEEERYFILVSIKDKDISYKKVTKDEAMKIASGRDDKKASCSAAAKSLKREKSKSAARKMRCEYSPLPPCKNGLAGIGYIFGPHK